MAKVKYGVKPHSWAKHLKEYKKFFWRSLRRKWKLKNERFSSGNKEYDI